MAKKRTTLRSLKKGKLPSKIVVTRYIKLRKAGFSAKIADELSRVKLKRRKK